MDANITSVESKILSILPSVPHADAIQVARAYTRATGETIDFHVVSDILDKLHTLGLLAYDYGVRWYDGYVVYKLNGGG